MRRTIYYIFSFCIIFNYLAVAQSITWQRAYDGPFRYKDGANSLSLGKNGNFYAVGYTYHPTSVFIRYIYILELNPYGDTVWAKYIGWNDIKIGYASVSDGSDGCVITGGIDSSFILKLDAQSNLVWYKNYGIRSTDCLDVKSTHDGGYIACGMKLTNDWYGYLLKIDSSGNLSWQNLYPSTEFRGYFNVVEKNDGYLLTGYITDAVIDTQQVLVTRVDQTGNLIWERRYNIYPGRDANGLRLFDLGGSILIAGTTIDSVNNIYKPFYMRIDTIGDPLFVKSFVTNKDEILYDFKVINSNRYVLTVLRDSTLNITGSKVIIVDSIGNVLKEKFFIPQNTGFIWFQSILPMPNGDIIFGGISDLTNNDSSDVYIVRTDSLLNAPPIGILKNENEIKGKFILNPVYPNPFNSETTISFSIPKADRIRILLYDVTGKLITEILDEQKNGGNYVSKLNASNYALASGVYFLKLESSSGYTQSQKIIFLK